MVDFVNDMMSFNGGRQPLNEARQIATDVSKYLAFADKKCDWKHLRDTDKMKEYVRKLERSKVGPYGIVTKIHRLELAIRYLRRKELEDIPSSITERLKLWKRAFNKDSEARKLSRILDENNPPDVLTKVQQLFSNRQLQSELKEILQCVREDLLLEKSEYNTLVTYLFLKLACENWQRPGSVIGLTVSEAKSPIREDGKVIFKSHEHKTKL